MVQNVSCQSSIASLRKTNKAALSICKKKKKKKKLMVKPHATVGLPSPLISTRYCTLGSSSIAAATSK
jgi:hypothetical protein